MVTAFPKAHIKINVNIMKKIFLIMCLLSSFIFCNAEPSMYDRSNNKKAKESRIEVVNEKTVIFKNVVKIEIITRDENQITYVYDLKKSKLVIVDKGSFKVDTNMGDYLILSSRKITKTEYDFIEEV